jgi:hypothetical protein
MESRIFEPGWASPANGHDNRARETRYSIRWKSDPAPLSLDTVRLFAKDAAEVGYRL